MKTPVKHEKQPLAHRMGLQPFRRAEILFIADGLQTLLTAGGVQLYSLRKDLINTHGALTETASFSRNSTSL